MRMQVWDDGESECSAVMVEIEVESIDKITSHESEQTSIGCLITREADEATKQAKQMTAIFGFAGAAWGVKANRHQASIVKLLSLDSSGLCKQP
jgi:hypothetical protein